MKRTILAVALLLFLSPSGFSAAPQATLIRALEQALAATV
jgi:hypothetical protein